MAGAAAPPSAAQAEYAFACRNVPAYPLAELQADVARELDHLCSLSFAAGEVAYLRGLRFIKSDFADFLTLFRFQRHFITVGTDGDTLTIRVALYRHFAGRTMTGFGIGTNLSNDVGIAPLNIVMKLMSCNGQPVAKLSDSPGKTMCTDQTFLAYLRQVFKHRAA